MKPLTAKQTIELVLSKGGRCEAGRLIWANGKEVDFLKTAGQGFSGGTIERAMRQMKDDVVKINTFYHLDRLHTIFETEQENKYTYTERKRAGKSPIKVWRKVCQQN